MSIESRTTVAEVVTNGKAKKPVINAGQEITLNSLADAHSFFKTEMDAMEDKAKPSENFLRRLVTNDDTNMSLFGGMGRNLLASLMLDGPRDIDDECGYVPWLTPFHYQSMYDREGIAKRVVHCEPEETWVMDPEVYEDEDPETDTPFEEAVKDFVETYNIWHYLQRIDILSGIGQFGILMFGLNDEADLITPVDGIDDQGEGQAKAGLELNYMRPFAEEVVWVKTRERDVNNKRYGMPTMYTIRFRDFPNWGVQAGEIIDRDIHWTRCLHVADNRKMSEVFGIPRQQQVWNRLYDLRKSYSSSGEALWKGVFPGFAFEVNPDLADQNIEMDKEGIRKEMDRFSMGTQRYLALQGVTAKTLPPSIVDPTPTIEAQLKAIAISMDIPYRVLFGSEEAKLAGSKDSEKWNKHLARRQSKYVSPMIVRPFFDRMIQYGILPQPKKKKYFVDWPDLSAPTDVEKAQTSLVKTQALAAYVAGGVDQLVQADAFLTHIMGMTVEEKDAILEATEEANQQQSDDMEMDDGNIQSADPADATQEKDQNEGGLNFEKADDGDALRSDDLTAKGIPGKKLVGAELIQVNSPTVNHVVKRKGKYYVVSEDRSKTLGGPYPTRGAAAKRLGQIEYFKHKP